MDPLRTLKDLLTERGQDLTFADLPSTLLEDLALGWTSGRTIAAEAASWLARIDGIPAGQRGPELAGRALLTLLARRGAAVAVRIAAENVRLLGDPSDDEGDAEAAAAYADRERQYASLTERQPEYGVPDFVADAGGAFAAARAGQPATEPPPDTFAAEHALALLGTQLPAGLRRWFHARHPAEAADAAAWRFFLTARALAHHHDRMEDAGVVAEGDAVPTKLLAATLLTDLGELARTAILEPV